MSENKNERVRVGEKETFGKAREQQSCIILKAYLKTYTRQCRIPDENRAAQTPVAHSQHLCERRSV